MIPSVIIAPSTFKYLYMSQNFLMKITVGRIKIPAIYLGTSPFIGAGQFGDRARSYRDYWLKNDSNLIRAFEMAEEYSAGVQAIPYPEILRALKETGVECIVSVGIRDFEREIDEIGNVECRAILLHASRVDGRMKDEIEKNLEIITEMGYIGGVATHNPARTLREIMDLENSRLFLVPINRAGLFMGDRDDVTGLVKKLRDIVKRVIAMKTLGAGKLSLEDIDFAIEHADGVAVGIGTFRELEETFGYLRGRFES